MKEKSLVRFDNGFELVAAPLPWGHCIEVSVKDLGGNPVHGEGGPRGPILPIAWYPAFEQDVERGRIFDKTSMEAFYAKMSDAAEPCEDLDLAA